MSENIQIYKNTSNFFYSTIGIFEILVNEDYFYLYVGFYGCDTKTIKEMEDKKIIKFIG